MKTLAASLALTLLLIGCTAQGVKPGDPCNGSGSCKAPLSCYEGPKGSFCGTSCGMDKGQQTCSDPAMAPVQTTYNGLAAGCACLPK